MKPPDTEARLVCRQPNGGLLSMALPPDPARACWLVRRLAGQVAHDRRAGCCWTVAPLRPAA